LIVLEGTHLLKLFLHPAASLERKVGPVSAGDTAMF